MEHLSILMGIKLRFNQNSFTYLEFSNFTIFDQYNCLKLFKKGKFFLETAGFELDIDLFVANSRRF